MTKPHTLIVGVGSPHGDDQAGWLVAEHLLGRFDQDHTIVRRATSPGEILDWLVGTDGLIVCDACRGLGHIGAVKRWMWPDRELMAAAWSSTHDLPLPAVLQLADRIGRLPSEVVVYGVEAATSGPLDAVSDAVLQSIPKLGLRIANELGLPPRCLKSLPSV